MNKYKETGVGLWRRLNKTHLIIAVIVLALLITGIILVTQSFASPGSDKPQDNTAQAAGKEENNQPAQTEEPVQTDKLMAITFDDGPSPVTPSLLDGLKERGVKVTFFVLGACAKIYPDTVKRAYDEGHCIAIHGYDHKNEFTKLTSFELQSELNNTGSIVYDIIGETPNYVRPPYGSLNATTISHIYLPIILWSVDTRDWATRNAEMVRDSIIENAKDGAIVLLHDLYETSRDGVLMAIDELQKDGWAFVTLEELFIRKRVQPHECTVYRSVETPE